MGVQHPWTIPRKFTPDRLSRDGPRPTHSAVYLRRTTAAAGTRTRPGPGPAPRRHAIIMRLLTSSTRAADSCCRGGRKSMYGATVQTERSARRASVATAHRVVVERGDG